MKNISMTPIGTVHSSRAKIEDDNWDAEKAYVELDSKSYSAESLAGLSDFSHVEIIFYMDQTDPAKAEKFARHPRGNKEWPKVGIFAQRAKYRPNFLGTTICKILKVQDLKLYLEGLDAIDGTPVLDIKPWLKEFEPRGPVSQPQWTTELMKNYWLSK